MTLKEFWDSVPIEYNYVAIGRDWSDVMVFTHKPSLDLNVRGNLNWIHKDGYCEDMCMVTNLTPYTGNENWKESLLERIK